MGIVPLKLPNKAGGDARGGGGGGKARDQGEHHGISHSPDQSGGKGVPGITGCAGKSATRSIYARFRKESNPR